MRDAVIEHCLKEKHRLFVSITPCVTDLEEFSSSEGRLLCGYAVEPQQGEYLLSRALKDGETCFVGKKIHIRVKMLNIKMISVGLLQQLLLEREMDQCSSTTEGVDLMPLPKRPGSFAGFVGDAYMQQGSKSKSAVSCAILFYFRLYNWCCNITNFAVVDWWTVCRWCCEFREENK